MTFSSLHSHYQRRYNLRRAGGINGIRYIREQPQHQQRCVFSKKKREQEKQQEKMIVDRAALAHEYAQKLNNISAMCIEIAKYDKAIESLGKALRLSELHKTDQLLDRSESCNCQDCSLDACIQHGENDSNIIEMFDISSKMSQNNNKNKNSRKRNTMDNEDEEHTPATTLYRKPIRIPKRSIQDGHNMGSTLFLIITFNLALAHHLKALKCKTDSSFSTRNLLNTTIKLYELVNNLQCPSSSHESEHYVTESDDSHDDDEYDLMLSMGNNYESNKSHSAHFQMILYNNLNHLNQMMVINKSNNDTRSRSLKRRLNDLTSTVSPVVVTDKKQYKW